MNKEMILKQVEEIFRDVFDDETIELCDETSPLDIEDWDSLEQINLILQIEEQFKMKFDIDRIIEIDNVGTIIRFIDEKIN